MKHLFTTVALATILPISAFAASVHFVPKVTSPVWVDHGLTLSETGKLAGLGNGDVVINITAMANATAVCINPGSGAHQPPGQNPAPVTAQGSEIIPQSEVKNGTVSFSLTTQPPVTPIPGAPGCPNTNWTEQITDLSFTSALTTIMQRGVTELSVSCTFDPATVNGVVPSQTVSCSTN